GVDLFGSPNYNNGVSNNDDQQSVTQAINLLPELRPESQHGDLGRSDHQAHLRGELGAAPSKKEIAMYIAMNRFKVMKGAESAFEQVWLSRDTHLDRVPGFIEFHLLRGPERDDHV